jgi:hypothetical protein
VNPTEPSTRQAHTTYIGDTNAARNLRTGLRHRKSNDAKLGDVHRLDAPPATVGRNTQPP